MNKNQISSTVVKSYQSFINDFANPELVDKEKIEKQIGPIKDVFINQKTTDMAKQKLGRSQFHLMLSLYFYQYQTKDGINFERLDKDLKSNLKVYLRHIGSDKVNYLKLVVDIMRSLRGGLLQEEAS